jgi:hypothetical protein
MPYATPFTTLHNKFWWTRRYSKSLSLGYESSGSSFAFVSKLERVEGIEPSSSAWQADVIPLYDTRIVWYSVVESNYRHLLVRQRLSHLTNRALNLVVPKDGIEPRPTVLETVVLPLY